jgi:hypothetical protein
MSANTHVVNKWIKRFPFVMITLAVVVVLSYLVIAPLPTLRLDTSVSGSESSIQRGIEADAARYTAMAKFYAEQKDSIRLGIEADAARYTAMAKYYMSK